MNISMLEGIRHIVASESVVAWTAGLLGVGRGRGGWVAERGPLRLPWVGNLLFASAPHPGQARGPIPSPPHPLPLPLPTNLLLKGPPLHATADGSPQCTMLM